MQEKPVILTCAQPTGGLTLGNYLGAVRNWSRMQDDHECYFGIVDMHSITVPCLPAELRSNTLNCLAQYIACGLDPEKSRMFVQSHVIGHTELAWVLACLTPLGELQRMTQFKEKVAELGFKASEGGEGDSHKFTHSGSRPQASINSGLLSYPVLMAADILLYNADLVPVGEDQRQHLELCRDLAQRFNQTYSETFKIPEAYMGKTGARVMSLAEPTRKMSKSDENQNATIFIQDEPDRIRKKIASAVTDSGNEVEARPDKPGVANLLSIHSAITGEEIPTLEKQFSGQGYGTFKEAVAEAVVETLRPVREKYLTLVDDEEYLLSVLQDGGAAAQKRAYRIISKVYRKVGFVERPR
uniref:tryptophan--tRNA ligase n=1 Tax=uncultured marine microorganism HF4000_APKG3D20 TaxID=455549 RepID=B3T7A6_9ZZZZ|nr:putative tRNA synthetases class I (W and Y) [uncultured marine microorganism HF4000_APKG3D20]